MADKSKQFANILEQNTPARGPVRRGSSGGRGSNSGRGTHIGGYFDAAVAKQLRILAVTEDVTLTDLVAEAIDLLFQSRGLPEIAQEQEVKEG